MIVIGGKFATLHGALQREGAADRERSACFQTVTHLKEPAGTSSQCDRLSSKTVRLLTGNEDDRLAIEGSDRVDGDHQYAFVWITAQQLDASE